LDRLLRMVVMSRRGMDDVGEVSHVVACAVLLDLGIGGERLAWIAVPLESTVEQREVRLHVAAVCHDQDGVDIGEVLVEGGATAACASKPGAEQRRLEHDRDGRWPGGVPLGPRP